MTHNLTKRTGRSAVNDASSDESRQANALPRVRVWLPPSNDQPGDQALAHALEQVLLTSGRPYDLHRSGVVGSHDAVTPTRYSVVLPVFNESETLPELHRRLSLVMEALAEPYEIIFVDDGSRDASGELLHALQTSDPHVRVLRLSLIHISEPTRPY